MASTPPLDVGACTLCGRAPASTPRTFLNLEALCLHELPPHADISQHKGTQGPTLVEYLGSVLTEAFEVNFDDHTWSHHGKFPLGKSVKVSMPPLKPASESAENRDVPVEVDKRVKGEASSPTAFLARSSYHAAHDVEYEELDSALAQDHCRKEAIYDPSIFDGNELLKWVPEELQRAVTELNPKLGVKGVQMSMYEMFHEMPKILGKSLLKDRVFHVLCITAHSSYQIPDTGEESTSRRSQSYTVQLPVNIESFQDVPTIVSRSHLQFTSKTYRIKDQAQATGRQKKHNCNKVIEGIYCSCERLVQAPTPAEHHRWDMMTRSDARGSTRFAPWSIKRNETLEAIAKDVQYVLEHIRNQRLAAKGVQDSTY